MIKDLGGSFSGLSESMFAWYRTVSWKAAIDGEFLEAFVRGKLGTRHHLAGLVTYMLQAAELRRIASNYTVIAEACDFSVDRPYRLGPQTRVLRDIPDCPKFLDYLLAHPGEETPHKLRRRRCNFLLQMTPGDRDTVRNYVLTDAAAAVLESFREPQSVTEFRARFRARSGYPAPPVEFLGALASRRVIQPA